MRTSGFKWRLTMGGKPEQSSRINKPITCYSKDWHDTFSFPTEMATWRCVFLSPSSGYNEWLNSSSQRWEHVDTSNDYLQNTTTKIEEINKYGNLSACLLISRFLVHPHVQPIHYDLKKRRRSLFKLPVPKKKNLIFSFFKLLNHNT